VEFSMLVDSINKKIYEKSATIRQYLNLKFILPEERLILSKYENHIKDKTVLEIGFGGGRITEALSQLTQDYIGLDYSKPMVEMCQKQYGHLKFIEGDASNMNMFKNDSFDFIIFAFNSIDCMSHEKRLQILREVYRTLKLGGIFAFSTHNLDYKHLVTAYNIRDINILNNIRNVISYFKVRKYQVFDNTYSILSDPLAGFGHLIYNIRIPEQISQLRLIGFKDIEIINRNAEFITDNTIDRDSNFFHYICYK
jgi:ubiquinone/menaquinone biosynthesis C-methylase UbiE